MALDTLNRKSNIDFVSDMKSDVKEGSLSTEDGYIDEHYKMWLQRNGMIHNNTNYRIYLENIKDNFSKYDKSEVDEAKRALEESIKEGNNLLDDLESIINKENDNTDSSLKGGIVVNASSNTNQNNSDSNNTFNMVSLLCEDFVNGLNKCTSNEELVNYINGIVDSFKYDENTPSRLGTGNLLSSSSYKNGGVYSGFINPNIMISNSTLGFSYHIYDRDYLYLFAYKLRKLNLPAKTNLLPYIMKFLDYYFGFPKDTTIDMREDVLYNWALNNAEKFYGDNNITISSQFDNAVDQMQINGEFPLSALKGTNSAKCVERAALAQNLMKVCGFNTSIMYGDCESRKKVEGHCWNAISDENNNIYIIDFSNTVYSYQNGQFIGREPYSISISNEQIINSDGIVEIPDYHYENGKRVADNINRKYAIGKALTMSEDLTSGNGLK